ncbi:MAG TPA: glycosyltransferase family 1 protein, partial [Actinomycetota bacterium]|nr:glycosyltransferase family 1 protein [Actinomycetota bacterium]
ALARTIETVVANPATAARLAEAGRQSAAARFTTTAAARAYAAIYAEALQSHRPRRPTAPRRAN